MNRVFRIAGVPLLGLSLLPAQSGATPPEPKDAKKVQEPAPKDDAATQKDPAIMAIDKFIDKAAVDKKSPNWRTSLKQPPKLEFDANSDYLWHLETEVGKLTIRFFADTAPMHVSSGIYLARLGFYDGLNFHRIITGFMAQGGDPAGNGTGGPGYRFDGEFGGGRSHDKPGILSMANAGPGTDGSQFFITFVPTTQLDPKHTIWGEVTTGMETVKALEGRGNQSGKIPNPPKIVKTTVQVVPKAAPKAPGKPKEGDKPRDPEKKEAEKKEAEKK